MTDKTTEVESRASQLNPYSEHPHGLAVQAALEERDLLENSPIVIGERMSNLRINIWTYGRNPTQAQQDEYVEKYDKALPMLASAIDHPELYDDVFDTLSSITTNSVNLDLEHRKAILDKQAEFIDRNIELMVARSDQEQTQNPALKDNRNITIRNLGVLVSNGTEPQRNHASIALDANIARWINDVDDLALYETYVQAVLRRGTEGNKEKAIEIAVSFFQDSSKERRDVGLEMMESYFIEFSNFERRPREKIVETPDRLYDFVRNEIGKYVPYVDDLVQCHLVNGPENRNGIGVLNNVGVRLTESLARIIELEEERPGITKYLRIQNGIRSFFRYPTEVLIRQFDERMKKERRGIVIYAVAEDLAGEKEALSNETTRNAVLNLSNGLADTELSRPIGLEIYEAADREEFAARLINARRHSRQYSPTAKLAFGIVMGHGDSKSISFWNFFITPKQRRGYLYIESLKHPAASMLASSFEDGASIIFDGCENGQDLAREVSRLGLRTTGPISTASLHSFTPRRIGENLVIEGEWSAPGATYYNGEAV